MTSSALASRLVALAAVLTATLGGPRTADADWLTPKEIARVMSGRAREIRHLCWEQASTHTPTSVRVDFIVAPSGKVTSAEAKDAAGDAKIVACVVAEVKRTEFPKTDGGGANHWPFVFK
jgi:hypothetical protein